MSLISPSEAQFDALREVANVGCGHAANALSKLVGGRTVRIDVPRVVLTRSANIAALLGGEATTVVVTSLEMLGELQGRLLLILEESDAHRLATELMAHPNQLPLDSQISALEEAGNIVVCACLNAIGTFTGLRLLASTPTVSRAAAGDLAQSAVRDLECSAGLMMVLEARFSTTVAPMISGQLLVLPKRDSVDILLQKLGV